MCLLALVVAVSGCKFPGHANLPPAQMVMHPGPGVDGPGPGVMVLQPPPVNVEEVRAAARNEARVEAMQRELERQRAEIIAAKQARSESQPQPDLMTQIAKIRETAAALGMERKAAGGGAPPAPPPPSGFEQLADMLDTQGGKVLVEKLADRFFGGGDAPQQPQPQPQQLQQPQPQQPQQLPPQYAISPEQQVFYGGDPEAEDQPD
jgi:hypothetical protein